MYVILIMGQLLRLDQWMSQNQTSRHNEVYFILTADDIPPGLKRLNEILKTTNYLQPDRDKLSLSIHLPYRIKSCKKYPDILRGVNSMIYRCFIKYCGGFEIKTNFFFVF